MTEFDNTPNGDPDEKHTSEQTDVMHLHRAVMRELDEPRDGFSPTPVWLLFVYFALIAWGGSYIALHNGGWRSDMYSDDPAALLSPPKPQAPPDPMVVGARVFNTCAQCHQPDGRGLPGTYPPLAGSEWVVGRKEVLARIVLGGAEGTLNVKGRAYDGQMPSWAASLSDEKIASVLTYIRSSFGNKAGPVDVGTVSQIRKEMQGRTGSWSEAELKAVLASLPPETAAPAKPAATPAPATPTAGQ